MVWRTRSSTAGSAFDGAPQLKGGCGSYSMLSCIPFAVSSPAILATSVSADRAYDLHALLELVDRGCPPELATRILAPLGPGDPQ